MRSGAGFSVPTKMALLALAMLATFLLKNPNHTAWLVLLGLVGLCAQRQWRFAASFAVYYAAITALLLLTRHFGGLLLIFSEFYVFMAWWLSAVFLASGDLILSPPGQVSAFLSSIRLPAGIILGVLVVFRFFPTMRAELRGLRESMRNRGLLGGPALLWHPLRSFEYVLAPLLMRILQIADRLSVSAVARAAEAPCRRSSYYRTKVRLQDYAGLACALAGVCLTLGIGGIK